MKRFERIKTGVFIFLFVLICLFLHDFFTFHPKSENLFFPKLHENYCFSLAFDREIKDEKVISFECFEEMWAGRGRYVTIIMFCYEGCGTSGDIFQYPMKITREFKKQIEKLEKESQHKYQYVEQKRIEEVEKDSQQYGGFYQFKSILKPEYYRKYREPLTEAVISHFYSSSDRETAMLWYDNHSKIFWYEKHQVY